jgi:hypothetical protein
MNDGTDWAFDSRWGTYVPTPYYNNVSTSINNWSSWPQLAHLGEPYYIPYLMTGDWKWLYGEIETYFANWGEINPGENGSQLNRMIWGSDQQRGDAWGLRGFRRLALNLPDSDTAASPSPVLGGWTKDAAKTYLENQFTATNSGTYDDDPIPGAIIQYGTGSCPGGATCNLNYTNPGARWTSGDFSTGLSFSGYMMGYFTVEEAASMEEGMLSTNGLAFYNWLAVYNQSILTTAAQIPGLLAAATYWWGYPLSSYYNLADIYQGSDLGQPGQILSGGYPPGRVPSGIASLTGKTGTITVTVPHGYLASGSWYDTGYFQAADGGYCQFATVTIGVGATDTLNSCVVDNAFGSTSYTNTTWAQAQTDFNGSGNSWVLPYAAPGDQVGLEQAGLIASFSNSLSPNEYLNITQVGALMINQCLSISGSATALSNALSYSGGTANEFNSIKWNVAARGSGC